MFMSSYQRMPAFIRQTVVGAAAFVLTAASIPPATAQDDRADSVRALQSAIVEGLGAGRDVSEQVASLARASTGRARAPHVKADPTAAGVDRALAALTQSLRRLRAGSTPQRLAQWQGVHERWLAADLLFRAHLDDIDSQVRRSVPRLNSRLLQARQRYDDAVSAIVTPFADLAEEIGNSDSLQELDDDLWFQTRLRLRLWQMRDALARETEVRAPQILRASALPFRTASVTRRAPVTEPAIVASYDNTQDVGPPTDAAELRGTTEAPLSEEIINKAESLSYDYVRIYEFVRNEIRTEWYAGAMKGATGTLRQGAGNDVDQASLLIALFRASGLPSRYVHGVVELSLDQVAASLGFAQTDGVTSALDAAGIAYKAVIRGGRVAAVQVEWTWVTVYVPYTNYRGTVVDASGKLWIPLMPSFKGVAVTPSTGVFATAGLSADAVVADYLSAPQIDDLRTVVEEQVVDHLTRTAQEGSPVAAYADQPGHVSVIPQNFDLLPSTLAVPVIAVTAESASLDPAYQQRVQIIARAGVADASPPILDITLPVAQVASERLTLSYEPASVDDQIVTNLFGGLDLVPAYLVKMRPRLALNGKLLAAAEGAIDAGSQYRVEVRLLAPGAEERLTQTLTAGSYHAFGLSAQGAVSLAREPDPTDIEFEGARILDRVAQDYNARWAQAEREFARLLDVALIKPLPDVTIVSNAMHVDTVLGQPSSVRFEGVTIDASAHFAAAVSRTGAPAASTDWAKLSALQGSVLEHRIFEEQFLVQSVSADKGLQLARAADMQVLDVNATNLAVALDQLDHPAAVEDDVAAWVALGYNVEIPLGVVELNAWAGSVWRVEDPASGAAGYFIAGGLAGGATTEDPTVWANEVLRDLLANSYSPPANANTLAAATVIKLSEGDNQQGEVGETLPRELAVRVKGVDGRPVLGAPVTFRVVAGGGTIDGMTTVTQLSDARGIASVPLTLGTRTDSNPFYTLRAAGDRAATRASLNWVEVTVRNATGALSVSEPFVAVALPKAVSKTVVPQPTARTGSAGQWSDSLIVRTLDEFNNPVANAAVNFLAQPPVSTCSPQPANVQRAHFFTFGQCPGLRAIGSCGLPSASERSDSDGSVSVGVILGDAGGTTYPVDVIGPGSTAAVRYTYDAQENCDAGPAAVIVSRNAVNADGVPINAARPGRTLPEPAKVQVSYSVPEHRVVGVPGSFMLEFLPKRQWFSAQADLEFTTNDNGSAGGTLSLGNGLYQANIVAGNTPGSITVSASAQVQVPDAVVGVDPDTGALVRENLTLDIDSPGPITQGFAVEPEILGVQSEEVVSGMREDALHLDPERRSRFRARVNYGIAPSGYSGLRAEVEIYDGSVLQSIIVAPRAGGESGVLIARGTRFDSDDPYRAELVLNRGTPFELRSQRVELPILETLIRSFTRNIEVRRSLDTLNQFVCDKGTTFSFELSEEADVSLVLAPRVTLDENNEVVDPSATTILIDDERFGAGTHSIVIDSSNLPPAEYQFVLAAVATGSDNRQVELGRALSESVFENNLPVGHTIVKGVDVFDGNLVVSSTDLSVPGRGVPLELRRSYGSNGGSVPGPLGVGWNHNYISRILPNRCGVYTVIGGACNGIRFTEEPVDPNDPDSQRVFVPTRGYHGQLVRNEDDSFDFFPKDGTRYRYRDFGTGTLNLELIQDTNGNVTRLGYDRFNGGGGAGDEVRLGVVENPSGRKLQFAYDVRTFNIFGPPNAVSVLRSVTGPDGQQIVFEYDDRGNLIRAAREDDARIERYEYIDEPKAPTGSQHKLARYIDANGHATRYEYSAVARSFVEPGGARVVDYAFSQVDKVIEPESGETTFVYDGATRTTTVTNGRDAVSTYEMNEYGSVTALTDPAGTTRTTWTPDDVLPLSRTDANEVETVFTYDPDGNLLTEVVDGTHTTTFTYEPATQFAGGRIRSRVASKTDRNNHSTLFRYDPRGNLIESEDAEGNITRSVYADNGDRLEAQDGRGFVTRFTYDRYGNVATAVDPLGQTTRSRWDERSRLVEVTDTLGRVTRNEYDTLNRQLRRIDALGGVREMSWDPVGNKLTETDEEERTTIFEYDEENRLSAITNARNDRRTLRYDAAGNKTFESDFRGNETTFEYDGDRRIVTAPGRCP